MYLQKPSQKQGDPSSSRFSGADHNALNIPKYSDIGSSIITLYCNELTRQVSALGPVEKNDLNSKWIIDIDTHNMFISKRACKKSFGIFF